VKPVLPHVALALSLIILAAVERILQSEAKARQKAEQLQLTLEHMSQTKRWQSRLRRYYPDIMTVGPCENS